LGQAEVAVDNPPLAVSSSNSAAAAAELSSPCQVMKNDESRSSKEVGGEASGDASEELNLKQRLAVALTAMDENKSTQMHTRSEAACQLAFVTSVQTHSNGPNTAWEAAAAAQGSAAIVDFVTTGNGSKMAVESLHVDMAQTISFQTEKDMIRLMRPPLWFRGQRGGRRKQQAIAAAQARAQTSVKSLDEVSGMYASPMPKELPSTKLAGGRKLVRYQ